MSRSSDQPFPDRTVPQVDLPPSDTPFGPGVEPDDLGTLGRYRIRKLLGRGGMGAVYRGYDPRLDRKVAIKVMRPDVAAQPDAKERFLREAKSAARLNHEHIVPILDADEVNGTAYIAMPFMKGYPLDVYLREQGGRLPVGSTLRIGKETAEGLSAAHAQGLVHRDVKPGNVFLEAPKGRVKLLDFGLACQQKGDDRMTASRVMLGTPMYMAPEQAQDSRSVEHRADLWSLGVVLYELLGGRRPFTGESLVELLYQIANHTPPPVVTLNPDVPAALSDLIDQLLAKRPEDRPRSAGEVATALAFIHAGMDSRDEFRLPSKLLDSPQSGIGAAVGRVAPVSRNPDKKSGAGAVPDWVGPHLADGRRSTGAAKSVPSSKPAEPGSGSRPPSVRAVPMADTGSKGSVKAVPFAVSAAPASVKAVPLGPSGTSTVPGTTSRTVGVPRKAPNRAANTDDSVDVSARPTQRPGAANRILIGFVALLLAVMGGLLTAFTLYLDDVGHKVGLGVCAVGLIVGMFACQPLRSMSGLANGLVILPALLLTVGPHQQRVDISPLVVRLPGFESRVREALANGSKKALDNLKSQAGKADTGGTTATDDASQGQKQSQNPFGFGKLNEPKGEENFPKSATHGTLRLVFHEGSREGMELFFDGKKYARPWERDQIYNLPVGSHQVDVRWYGEKVWTHTFDISDKNNEFRADVPRLSKPTNTLVLHFQMNYENSDYRSNFEMFVDGKPYDFRGGGYYSSSRNELDLELTPGSHSLAWKKNGIFVLNPKQEPNVVGRVDG